MSNKNLRPVRFYIGDDPVFDGFTDDTYWNGWLNVWVTEEVHEQVKAAHPIDNSDYDYWDIQPDDDGLISYAYGFCAAEQDDERDQLGADYAAEVGYNPFEDDDSITTAEVRQMLDEVRSERRSAEYPDLMMLRHQAE